MTLFSLIVLIAVVCLIVYLIRTGLIPQPWATIVIVIAIIVLLLILLSMFGGFGSMGSVLNKPLR